MDRKVAHILSPQSGLKENNQTQKTYDSKHLNSSFKKKKSLYQQHKDKHFLKGIRIS